MKNLHVAEKHKQGVLQNRVSAQVRGGVAPQDGCIQSVGTPRWSQSVPAPPPQLSDSIWSNYSSDKDNKDSWRLYWRRPKRWEAFIQAAALGAESKVTLGGGGHKMASISPKAPPQLTGLCCADTIRLQREGNIDLTSPLSNLISISFSRSNRSKHSINILFYYGLFSQ